MPCNYDDPVGMSYSSILQARLMTHELQSKNALQKKPNAMADGGVEGSCLAPLPSATVHLLKSGQVTKTFQDKTGFE